MAPFPSVRCANCAAPYPDGATPFKCTRCGGVYDFDAPLPFDPAQVEPGNPGIWKYAHVFGLPSDAPQISLGEGGTPLVWADVEGLTVGFKCEYQNPTASFKDRGSPLLVSFLRSRRVDAAAEDSSGNAGASFAAYAARAGMLARVFVPDSASGSKRRQIAAYGAQIVSILGPRSNAAQAVLRAVEEGAVYASHAYLPFNIPGYATLAYELVEELGEAPGTVFCPAGQGGLLLGLGRGFAALQRAGVIPRQPRLVGVQASLCAPLWAVHAYAASGLMWVGEGETLAEGIRVRNPVRGDAVLAAVAASDGTWFAVDEQPILEGRDQLARQGFYVEATSAVVWEALRQLAGTFPQPVVAVLTGSGLKDDELHS